MKVHKPNPEDAPLEIETTKVTVSDIGNEPGPGPNAQTILSHTLNFRMDNETKIRLESIRDVYSRPFKRELPLAMVVRSLIDGRYEEMKESGEIE